VSCPPGGIELYTPAVAKIFPLDISENDGYFYGSAGPGCGFEGALFSDGTEMRAVPFEGKVTIPFEAPIERLTAFNFDGASGIGMREADKGSPSELWIVVKDVRGSQVDVLLSLHVLAQAGGLMRAVEIATEIVSSWEE
jgi:hypothetical protein